MLLTPFHKKRKARGPFTNDDNTTGEDASLSFTASGAVFLMLPSAPVITPAGRKTW